MDAKTALDKVKEAEEAAQRLAEAASDEAQRIVAAAGQEKERLAKEAIERAKKDARGLSDETQRQTRQEIASMKNRSEADLKILAEKADRNFSRALEFLKKRLAL